MVTEIQLGKRESSGDGWWGRLRSRANALHATLLDMKCGTVKVTSFVSCGF